MAYTTVSDSTLYVQGGSAPHQPKNNQFLSLDLTTDWNTSSPPWKILPVGAGNLSAPVDYYNSMVATIDKENLVVYGSFTGISVYNIPSNTWVSDPPSINLVRAGGPSSMALDPTTGLIYIPNAANNWTGLLIYNPAASNTSIVPMYPHSVLEFQVSGASFVWSNQRRSFLFFGGFNNINNSTIFNPLLLEYQPTTYSWTRVVNVIPSPFSLASPVEHKQSEVC